MRRWFLTTGVLGALALSAPAWAQWQNSNLALRTTGSVLRSGDALRVELVAFETVNGPFSTQVTYRFRQPVTVKVTYHFKFLPLVGIAGAALGGLDLTSTQTERAEVVPPGGVSYAAVNQNNNTTGC